MEETWGKEKYVNSLVAKGRKPGRRRKDNIKVDLTEVSVWIVDAICVTQGGRLL